jgi:ABC-type amino acid transport substrate-binding protein/DNA-binding CsgD family transcriptional regulator/sugar lactone lactonase YvrE
VAFRPVITSPLTRREAEVAELVRDGLTNREMAARLFLSERTVEGHVAQICSKLGVRSRLQIATWILEQEGRQQPAELPLLRGPAPAAVPTRWGRVRLWLAAGLVLCLAAGGVVAFSRVSGATPSPKPRTIATLLAGLNRPAGVVAAPNRDAVYIADSGDNALRILAGDGTSQVLTGKEKWLGLPMKDPTGLAVDRAGRVYIADTGNNRVLVFDLYYMAVLAGTGKAGFAGDEAAAGAAQLDSPEAVAVDSTGNVYIADTGNNRIREVDAATGVIKTVAGGGNTDPFSGNYLGLYPLTMRLTHPEGVAVTTDGNLVIADTRAHGIYELPRDAAGSFGPMRRLAGTGTRGFSGDGRPAAAALISEPRGLAIDQQGNIIFADSGTNRIRKIDRRGEISTIAGSGALGIAGDSGAALSASLAFPAAVSPDNQGNLLIADTGNAAVRVVRPAGTPSAVKTSVGTQPSFPAGSYMAQIQARGKLIAEARDWAPFFAYKNPSTGVLEGFDVAMLRAVARAIFGRDDASVLEFVSPPNFDTRIAAVQSGAVDIADSTLVDDPAVTERVDLADPYSRTVDLLLVPKSSPVRSYADLAGKSVCIINAGFITPQLALEIRRSQPAIAGIVIADRDHCLIALHSGKVNAIYGHSPDTVTATVEDPTVVFTNTLQVPRLWAYAVPKGHPEFVQFLNGLVQQLQTDGQWNATARAWLNGYDSTFNPLIR